MDNLILANKPNDSIIESVVKGIETGEINPIELATQLKRIQELHKSLKDRCSPYIIKELEVCGSSNVLGYRVDKFKTGICFDFSSNDEWSKCEAVIQEMKEKQREIEKSIKQDIKNGVCGSLLQIKSGGVDSYKVTKTKDK